MKIQTKRSQADATSKVFAPFNANAPPTSVTHQSPQRRQENPVCPPSLSPTVIPFPAPPNNLNTSATPQSPAPVSSRRSLQTSAAPCPNSPAATVFSPALRGKTASASP